MAVNKPLKRRIRRRRTYTREVSNEKLKLNIVQLVKCLTSKICIRNCEKKTASGKTTPIHIYNQEVTRFIDKGRLVLEECYKDVVGVVSVYSSGDGFIWVW